MQDDIELDMKRAWFPVRFAAFFALCLFTVSANAAAPANWKSIGPDGGDARSFASDPANPQHLFLGTTSSWIYQSLDGGVSWKRLAKIGTSDDLVIDNIVIDRLDHKTMMAGAWLLDRPDGGIYISHDAGVTWTAVPGMQGQSVRALAQARSNAKVYVAGTLKGVYRSQDGGQHWSQISPQGSGEIREVESIAIDPGDANTIYAGTWHLPWKTTDGGASWHNIKQGVIDDSDVFSIIIDPSRPTVLYASACSGIYKSDTGGELFRKVQGIPSTARRTRVLMQDPTNRKVVYAGTTEGLYKTVDDGANWARLTGPDVIINDVYVDPRNPQHVLLATDRSGVLASNDAGANFQASNNGFSQRQISSLLMDAKANGTIYAGVVNDKRYGGVFVSSDSGKSWQQRSDGLDGRDVFSLAQSSDGTLLAGTSHGIYRWSGSAWQQDGDVINHVAKISYVKRKGRKTKRTSEVNEPGARIDARINQIEANGTSWFAATSDGIYRSENAGASWEGPIFKGQDYLFVNAKQNIVFAAQRNSLMLSQNGGGTWQVIAMPGKLTSVQALTTSPSGMLWVGGREGVFFSGDHGRSWQGMPTLPVADINGLSYDVAMKRVIVTSRQSTLVFAVDDAGKSWKWWNSGWKIHTVRSLNGRFIAASSYNGVVLQPDSEELASARPAR